MPTVNPVNGLGSISRQNQINQTNSIQQLSSGSRLANPSTDAAALAISTKLTAENSVLRQVATTASQGSSIGQIADGGLARVGDVLTRLKELAGQSLSGTAGADGRANIDAEFQQLLSEVDQIVQGTTFNGQELINGSPALSFQVGTNTGDTIELDSVDASAGALGLTGLNVTTQADAQAAFSAVDAALDSVSGFRSDVGATISRFDVTAENIASQFENSVAANSALADADIGAVSTQIANTLVQSELEIAARSQANKGPQTLLQLLEDD